MEYSLYMVIDNRSCGIVIDGGDINYYNIGCIGIIKIPFDRLYNGVLFNNGIGFWRIGLWGTG